MKWNFITIMALLFGAILFFIMRNRPIDMAREKELAPFYMSYNQPVRQGGGNYNPAPFEVTGNARKCLGCNPENSEIMAGVAQTINDEVKRAQQLIDDHIVEMNNQISGIWGG